MDILMSFGVAGAVAAFYMTVLFVLAVVLHDNSIADIAWGIGFILATVAVLFFNDATGSRNLLVTGLVAIWGLRLGVRIYFRNRGRGEDFRYKKWREEWDRLFLVRSYLQVFLLQGAVMIINLSPVLIVNSGESGGLSWPDLLGAVVWLTGFIFESVGDYQLDRFMNDPASRGKIMDRGLWRYTRHPNYFGEITMWWGIFIIALSAPYGFIGFVGPLLITVLIVFVSGIPMTERAMERDPAFREYRRRTSALIPWFPRDAR